jgi:hypothetical protein
MTKTPKTKTTTTSKKIKLHELVYDLPSALYHATPNSYSSSTLKDALVDEELFYKKHVIKVIEREEVAAFDVGTYFHTGVLEPHKITEDCIAFTGKVRRGREWDLFKTKHVGKVIVTPAQKEQAEKLVECVQDSPVAMGFIRRGQPEVSAFLKIIVYRGEIYAPFRKLVLNRDGWEDALLSDEEWEEIVEFGTPMILKVRADSLGEDFVLDLKSTTGNSKDEYAMREKIKYYKYELSAALYLDVFAAVTGRPYGKFIWTFASKDFHNSRSYLASHNNILIGRVKYKRALLKIADALSSNWEFADVLGVLEPHYSELEHLNVNEIDLV